MIRFLLLLLFPLGALAQVSGPAVETCRAYAEREARRDGAKVERFVIDNDSALLLERYTRKLGSQFVSSVLSGNGAITWPAAAPVELSFVCLLASDKQAVFFTWASRRDAPALAQCRRSPGAGDCLVALAVLAERDLIEVSAMRFQESLEADARAGNENASTAYRNGTAAWRAYRDAECGRRGAAGSEEWRGCVVDLTRRRYLDLR